MKIKTIIRQLFMWCLAIVSVNQALAQQDPQYVQYMYNPAAVNPGYAASVNNLQIFGLYRNQWVGLQGAPTTAYLSGIIPLSDNGLGMGVHFKNDQLGVMQKNSLSIDMAYTINLDHQYKLAFGLKATADLLDVNYDKLFIYDQTDPISQSNISNKFSPNIGAGVYLYSDRAYLGLSVPMILSSDIYNDNNYKLVKNKAHFYAMAGYVFDVSQQVQFKPAALAKVVTGAPLQVDLTANFMFVNKLTLGVGYRWDSSVSGLVGFQLSNELFIGYSYDADTSKLAHYNSGSHEIFVKFELFSNNKRKVAPRFF
ncbi:PorP/SprF family type IX secretion system membrane protein [Myroides sp. LJL110]